jgi:glycosyltransferase involved in cell wall biosynthesis
VSIQTKLSFCIGVCNEEKILLSSLAKIKKGFDKKLGRKNYEIIVVENGSTDNTWKILKGLNDKQINVYSIKDRGLGAALSLAIKKANFNNILLSAIDLPFGFSDLDKALPILNKYDLIYGSKANSHSKINTDKKRRAVSAIYRTLLKLIFNIKISDTQGSVFLKKDKVIPFIKFCRAKNSFFSAQLAIFGHIFDLKITEIPVKMSAEIRQTRFNVSEESRNVLKSIIFTIPAVASARNFKKKLDLK